MVIITDDITCLHTGSTTNGVILCDYSKIIKIKRIIILPYSKKGVARMFNNTLGYYKLCDQRLLILLAFGIHRILMALYKFASFCII
jgi:hypothetical protein